jgi:hypothetical protein
MSDRHHYTALPKGTNARRSPCSDCPWSRATPPGQFCASRYEALRATTGNPGKEVPIGPGIFACHKSTEKAPLACAGWLVAVGWDNLTVRLFVLRHELTMPVPDDTWPELFDNYDEMAATQGRCDAPSEIAHE